jgi:hypothetical protein
MQYKSFLKGILPPKLLDIYRVLRFPSNRYAFFSHPLTFNTDGLATSHNAEFGEQARFVAAYQRGHATGSWGNVDIRWRAHVICWAAMRAMSLPGDFVECGVNRGGYARMIVDYVNFEGKGRKFYLLDTYNGLVQALLRPEEQHLAQAYQSAYRECFEDVRLTFQAFSSVVLVRGPVPDTLPQVTSDRIAFLSIDMNCVEPEIAAGEYFWDKLTPGALVVLDDYAHQNHKAQKEAWDDFALRKGVEILSLPTSQGLIVKP